MDVCSSDADFYDVLLRNEGGIQWSAISLAMVTKSNLFGKDSGDGTSQSLDAVADEVMDIVGGQKLLFYPLKRFHCVD